ncbi:MAG TPA: sigma-54 dependent transcriptional regulator [Vicinamibacterales bacterium]|nr:sigma-54 dependent transcriptional regulator [Vicinamibacterales bacterium]
MSDRSENLEVRDRVLVVEDDAAQRVGLQQLLRSWGYAAEAASDGRDALEKIEQNRPTIVLSDLVMPNMGGLDLLKAIKQQDDTEITMVLMTAQGTVETAVEAIKQGAYDYVSKPVDPQRLRILLDQIVERNGVRREVQLLRRQLQNSGKFGKMIGASREMKKIYQVIEQAAPTSTSVLISGESGTGKELVAQTIHQLSPRLSHPFVPINCAAIPDTLLESELFGHEKGAFTGAIARRQGCFELANRGTLFLDEIAEMTPVTQAKLLRVLQERTFRPVGGQREQAVDVRVIAATNVDPPEAVKQGKLREDLFYRLNVFPIALPPLRERKDDLPILIDAFIREFNTRNGRSIAGVSDRAMATLEAYDWPGNVRELRNVIERATIVAKGSHIEPGDLPPLAGATYSSALAIDTTPATGSPTTAPAASGAGLVAGTTVDQAERKLIEITLDHTGGNKTRAAELLGISLKTLHNKLNRMKQ